MSGMAKVIGIYIVIGLICAGQGIQFYQDHQYLAKQGMEWVWRARATNDLTDMAKYLTKAEDILQNYHGNPAWPYPTPDTDFDLIRENINETIMNCYKWSTNTTTDFAYQQAVHNLQETINEIAGHLDNAIGQMGSNPGINPLGFVVWNILFWGWIPMFIGWWKFDLFGD